VNGARASRRLDSASSGAATVQQFSHHDLPGLWCVFVAAVAAVAALLERHAEWHVEPQAQQLRGPGQQRLQLELERTVRHVDIHKSYCAPFKLLGSVLQHLHLLRVCLCPLS